MSNHFNLPVAPDDSHKARLAWITSLSPDALRDLLDVAKVGALHEMERGVRGLSEGSPRNYLWRKACADLAAFLNTLCKR